MNVHAPLLVFVPALLIGLALPVSAELTAPEEISHTETVALIDEALAGFMGVVHVRLNDVPLSDAHFAAHVYIELERSGYIKRKDCSGGVCSFEETEIATRFRPPPIATRVRREWISSCEGRDNCIEAVWTVIKYKVGRILEIKHHGRIASVEYVVEARLTPLGLVIWPAMHAKITTTQTARLERNEKGWRLLSLWMRR